MENKDFEIEQESLDMNNMALSNVTKYLATYKNPKEWILDEKEAKAARVLKSVAPEKSSKVGSLAYSAGEVLRTTAALPRQFLGSVDLLSSALKDRFYPNAEESALQRWANNYGKLEAQREETSQELISQEVGDIDWYTWGAAGGQLIRDIALTGGIAKLGAKVATKAAEKRLAGTLAGEEVAQRYTRLMAGEGAKKAGSAAITGSVFAQEVGSRTVDDINQYIAKTGDADLKYYDPSVDLAVNIGVGALSAQIEKGLGVERFVPRLIARGAGEKIPGLTQILARGAEGMVGESLEEGAQETAGQIGEMIKGYRDWWDFDTDQILTSMTIGGVLGGTAGAGLYYINRRTAINRLVNEGMDKNLAADLVDTIASREINKTINNLSAATELNTKNGEAYDKLKAGIKRALELQGWSEKMIDPKTGAELSIDEYVDLTVNSQIINTAVREAFNSGITIDEFLDVAQFTAVDNFMVLRPLGTTEEINARIDEQKAIIARQQDLKKTGAGDNTILREAKMKKAILEKVRLNKIVNDEIQKVNLEEAKTPENVKEIETADKDVEALKTAPTASDFNASLDNNLTTAQKTKRLGNAVLKKIFGSDKVGFDSVITLPEYTNAKTALTNSAERIINFAKKHRTYGIQTDLRNALNLMRTVNQGNFLEHATTPSLDGTDVIAQNAFLYHFLFKDADTTTAFIDAYLERAEASISGETDTKLTKKDLVGQAFKATDNLMQVQAESAGIEYNSIYNEDGSYKDQNVAAVMMSYQNQFADDKQQVLLQPEQFDLADENARLDDIYPAYEGDTIEVDGKERTVYNSNGDRIAKSKEALTNFWRWFGDSKVVDEQGRPLVVYHSTKADFDTFKILYHKTDEGLSGEGFYFTPSKEYSKRYGDKTLSLYLSVQNMLEIQPTTDEEYTEITKGNFKPSDKNKDLAETLVAKYRNTLNDAQKQLLDWDMQDNMYDSAISRVLFGNKDAKQILKEQGYDGVKYIGKKYDLTEYTVYNNTQIKSVNNRGTFSADTGNILYQPGYASMRGDLIGGALDADAFEGKGEGTSVWAWGNYLLKNKDIDKLHYFDSFNRQGAPKILYEGQKVSNMFMSDVAQYDILLGLTNEKSKEDILSGLENTLNARKNEVERKTDYVYMRLENKIPRNKLSEMIQDAYKLIDLGGIFYTKYPENSIADDLQKKYYPKGENPEGKRFTDEFINVAESIALSYGGLDNAKIFRDSIKDLEVDIDIFKGMDIKKVSGLSGFTYKGTSVKKAVREPISKHLDISYDNYLASEVEKQATDVIRDAVIKNKNIGDALAKAADEEQASLLESAEKQKNRILNEHSFTDEQKKVLDDIFAESVLGGSKALDEESRLKIYNISKDKYTFNDQGKELWKISADLRNKYGFIFKSFESGAQKVKALREIADYFKNAKEEDFVLKSRASMYKFDVPENKYLLDFTKSLDRQSKHVKQALAKLYEETNLGDEPYDYTIKAINTKLPRIYKPAEILKDPKSRDDVVQTYDGIIDTFLMNWTKNGLDYAKKELNSLIVRQTDYAQLAKDSAKQLEKEKKTLDATDSRFYSVNKDIEHWTTSEKQHADYRDVAKFVKKKVDKIPDDANIDDYADLSYEFKADETGNALYRSIERSFKLTHNEEDIKLAKSLGAVDKQGNIHAQKAASKLLEKYGVQGVKYYGERDKTGFVTFGKTKPIERLFQGQQANGFFDPELNVILLGKNWNTMTLPHELAHYWLNTLFNVYKRVQSGELKANTEWIQEKKDMFAMLGIDENQDALTAGQQEKFARMTEAYLTGIGVSKEMSQTFKDFFAWVPEKYKSILQLGYLDDQGKLQYPFLDQKAVDFFNRWYENASLPSLPTSPERQRFMNVTDGDGEPEKVSIKEMNDREKEFAQDAEEQQRTDARLYNTLDENMPADIKPVADAQKVVIDERSNFLKESQVQQVQVAEEPKRRWFERKSRETEIQKAQEYIEKNLEHAKEVIFGDPELVPNDTGVDRATLINTYMALNNITPESPEWATLHTNIAINQSLAGTQLALSNDKSYGTYLDALREVENALELKAATNYAGSKNGARERFNADIQKFLDKELPAIFATQPNSKEREVALRTMFEKARTTFSGNTTGSFLNQVDLDYAKGQTKKTEAFMRWAINQIKKDAGAKLNNEQQAKLLQISAKAQQAMEDLDNRDAGKAVAAAQELRNWQMEKQALMGVSPQKFSLFGDYAPRAMLASFNTLVVANVPSTALNTVVVNATKTGLFGKNEVSKDLIDSEVKRIKAIYGATGMNLAQMEKPTSPSLLHGEKYSAAGQKWYDPYTILGKEDNFFRVPTFVNTLAQIASTDAKATGRSADDVFREYASINNQTDEAKLARKQALAVANMAVFTQNGALANCLNHIRSELNKLSRVTLGLEPEGFGLGNLIAPFLTTGANIAEMGIRGSLAPITTITTMVNKWRTGKELDPMKKLALRMDWTYFTMSAVSMVLLAALTSDDDDFYTDPYRTGIKYSPDKPYDSINIAGVWLDLDFFGPFSIPMRTAAKVIQAWKKDNGIGTSIMKGYAESAKSVLGDVPLAESIINNQVNWAVKKPGSWASSYLYTQANKLVPAQLKPISRAVSRGEDWIFEPFEGTTVGRKFNRNYGFDGAELTTQDLIELFTIKVQLDQSLNTNL